MHTRLQALSVSMLSRVACFLRDKSSWTRLSCRKTALRIAKARHVQHQAAAQSAFTPTNDSVQEQSTDTASLRSPLTNNNQHASSMRRLLTPRYTPASYAAAANLSSHALMTTRKTQGTLQFMSPPEERKERCMTSAQPLAHVISSTHRTALRLDMAAAPSQALAELGTHPTRVVKPHAHTPTSQRLMRKQAGKGAH